MKLCNGNHLLLLICSLLFAGHASDALSYDYSASIECLGDPLKPQYGGGIIINPELNHGLKGWSTFGSGKVEERESSDGNKFIVVHSRNQSFNSFSQKLYMHKEKFYTFSAWIQVSKGSVSVTAVFKTTTGFKHAGAVVAESGCWSMLKGGLTVDSSGPAELYFESKNTSAEIWVDNISLQPFTKKQWRSHQDQSIKKIRKTKVRFQAIDSKGKIIPNATISLQLNKPSFPFGSAISKPILDNSAYQNWFSSRFTVTTFENEMKWYSTEQSPGKEDYSAADAMVAFAQQHGISVRGHNIFWDDPKFQLPWVNSLSPEQLREATNKRINSIVSRYAGKVIGWDVVNENLHFSYFEDKLGANTSAEFFLKAHQLDGQTAMFMNEYNTIEESADGKATPTLYLKKLREIQSFPGYGGPTAIGLEGHFSVPNLPFMRASIDALAAAGLPIWLTEVDVKKDPNQAQYLEQVLREGHAHPAIKGIVMWAGWHPEGCDRMCLTDNNFKNLPTGDVVDKLIGEWTTAKNQLVGGTTDSRGFFETSLFHGDYDVIIRHPLNYSISKTQSVKVVAPPQTSGAETVHIQVHA